MDQHSTDNTLRVKHGSVGVMEWAVVVLAEPRVFKDIRLG